MRSAIIALLIGFTGIVWAVDVNVPETWSGLSLREWSCMDQSVAIPGTNKLTVSDGALQMVPETDPGAANNPRWSFIADATASDGRFVGSYYDVGAHTLEFSLYASCSASVTVELVNETDFIIYQATLSVSPGMLSRQIPIDAEHFSPDLLARGSLEDLLRNVEQVWITLDWDKAVVAPVFAIDKVQLLGAGSGYGEWIDDFVGLTFEQRLAGMDSDEDGITNADEFYADTTPDIWNPPFTVSAKGSSIEWISSSNCLYTVLRSTNLTFWTFEPVNIVAGSGNTMQFTDLDGSAQAFYKIQVERK